MEKVKEYDCIAYPAEKFVVRVREMIAEGWQPLGGVSIAFGRVPIDSTGKQEYKEQFIYSQSLVKY